jgi:hypothetical protein
MCIHVENPRSDRRVRGVKSCTYIYWAHCSYQDLVAYFLLSFIFKYVYIGVKKISPMTRVNKRSFEEQLSLNTKMALDSEWRQQEGSRTPHLRRGVFSTLKITSWATLPQNLCLTCLILKSVLKLAMKILTLSKKRLQGRNRETLLGEVTDKNSECKISWGNFYVLNEQLVQFTSLCTG